MNQYPAPNYGPFAIHQVKRGDTARAFQAHLAIRGVSLDIVSATMRLRTRLRVLLVERACTILQTGYEQDQSEPNVECAIETGDLALTGLCDCTFTCILVGGRQVTMPQGDYYRVRIGEDLAEENSSSSSSQSESS